MGSLQFMLPHGEPVVCGDFAGLYAASQLLRGNDVPPLGPAPLPSLFKKESETSEL